MDKSSRGRFAGQMQHVRKPVAHTSRPGRPQDRSKVTNGTGLLSGIDGRSSNARRYKDLIIGFVAQFGLRGDADVALVETAAALKLRIEMQTALMCTGERVDVQEIGRLSSELRHILSDLKSRAQVDEPVGGTIPNLSAV